MASYNKVVMIGNLTRDPEYKQLPSGQGVCRLGIAANRTFKNRQTGMQMSEVCFIDIDVWGAQAETCNQYLQKGKQILVEGRLKLDSWQDNQGNNRNKHSIVADRIVFLGTNTGNEDDDISQRNQLDDENDFSAIKESKKTSTRSEKKHDSHASFKDEPPFSNDELPF